MNVLSVRFEEGFCEGKAGARSQSTTWQGRAGYNSLKT